MSKYLIISLLVIMSLTTFAQDNKMNMNKSETCEFYPALLDSLYSYKYDYQTGEWKLDVIRYYTSSNGYYNNLVFLHGDTRKQYRKYEYYYDSDGNRDLVKSHFWGNDEWIINLRKESVFDDNGKKLSETRHRFMRGEWSLSAYYYYEYRNDKIYKSHYQAVNDEGVLFDVNYSINSWADNNLMESKTLSSINDSLISVREYFYNESDKLSENISYLPVSDVSSNTELKYYRQQLYYYDEYGLLRQVDFNERNNNKWEAKSKYLYFYKLDNANKVSVCHNGQTICISIDAVAAHLKHGDCLGECAEERYDRRDDSNEKHKGKDVVNIYPNPAKERITLDLGQNEFNIHTIQISDFYGRVVRKIEVNDQTKIEVFRTGLISGKYSVTMYGDGVYGAFVIFK